MKTLKSLILICLGVFLLGCQQDEPATPEDFGYLSLGITVEVESEPASGRIAAVNTDNFKVTIFQADGTEYLVIDPFSSAPPEVQLPTGAYYVEAHSNDLVEAAFDSPYYFARSDTFNIDKEELKTIDIEAKLANCKVAINFSSEVINVFDAYSGQVEVVSSGTTLTYAQGETREGYFVVEPLAVEVYLSYTKLDGSTIDRTFNASIDDPQPATLYNINVDATLEDGAIVFNLTVDEGVDTVDINLGGETGPENPVDLLKSSARESMSDMIKTRSGGFIFIGRYVTDQSESKAWIVKLDSELNALWEAGLADENSYLESITELPNGDFMAVGNYYIENGNNDIWIVKVSSFGNILWEKRFGGSGGESAHKIITTNDGNTIISCYTQSTFSQKSTNLGGWDNWVVKMDVNGSILWEQTTGGSANEIGRDIIELNDGSLIGTGNSYSFSNAPGSIWLYKLESNGSISWQKNFGGADNSIGARLLELSSGNILLGARNKSIGGEVLTSYGDFDHWIAEMDINGVVVSSKVFGGSLADEILDITQDEFNNTYVTGYSYSQDVDVPSSNDPLDIWIYKLDDSYNLVWSQVYGGSQNDSAVKVLSQDDKIIIGISTYSSNGIFSGNQGLNDVFFPILNSTDGSLLSLK